MSHEFQTGPPKTSKNPNGAWVQLDSISASDLDNGLCLM